MAWILEQETYSNVYLAGFDFLVLFSLNHRTGLLVNQGLFVPLFQIDARQICLLQNGRIDAPLVIRVAMLRLFQDPVALAYDPAIALGTFVADA